jgi:predicted RNA-binding protein associated with RNAse of E/G family
MERSHVLRFMREGDAHTIELFWDQAWSFVSWYVNLQAPLRVHGTFFDTTDWALDVVVDPDGTRAWKDEDDFAQAIELGVFDEAGAAAVRWQRSGELLLESLSGSYVAGLGLATARRSLTFARIQSVLDRGA